MEKVRCFFIKNTEPEYVWEVYLPTVRYRFKITRLFLFVKIVLYVPNACPSGAISGKEWHIGITREEIFSAETCSQYMKKQFQHIGRGAVCGICMKVCLQYQKRLHTPEKYDKI